LVEQITPADATVRERLILMRGWLVLWDMAVLVLLLAMLHRLNWHPALAILYGWSPLVPAHAQGSRPSSQSPLRQESR